MGYDLVKGDAGSKLVVTCRDNTLLTPINLSGKSVDIRLSLGGGPSSLRAMSITNAAAGIAEYQFTAVDLNDSGLMSFDIIIDRGLGGQITSVELGTLAVRKPLF